MRTLLLIIVSFIVGFFIHAFFFPDLFYNAVFQSSAKLTTKEVNNAPSDPETSLFTYSTFDGKQFSPKNITIKKGMYLVITNNSKDSYMWLNSINKLLSTNRGYGYLEAMKVRLDDVGTFAVFNKLDPRSQMTVYVKP